MKYVPLKERLKKPITIITIIACIITFFGITFLLVWLRNNGDFVQAWQLHDKEAIANLIENFIAGLSSAAVLGLAITKIFKIVRYFKYEHKSKPKTPIKRKKKTFIWKKK